MKIHQFLLLICGITCVSVNGVPRCIGENDAYGNNEVDWFIMYKIPINPYITETKNSLLSNKNIDDDFRAKLHAGKKFFYVDSRDEADIKISDFDINSKNNALHLTIEHTRKYNSNEMHAFYNDQMESAKRTKDSRKTEDDEDLFAHAKGVLNFNEERGFWLMHTTPQFSDTTKSAPYPDNGDTNGQIFFCINFNSDQLGEIAAQIFVSRPDFYKVHIPDGMKQKWPVLNHIMEKDVSDDDRKSAPFWRNTRLKSERGKWFDSFHKYGHAQADQFANQVAKGFKQSLNVQTHFSFGFTRYKNVCGQKFKTVKNIKRMKFETDIGGQTVVLEWNTSKDHSKWSVVADPFGGKAGETKHPIVCIGDMNRHTTQIKRGGGVMCINSKPIWRFFASSVDRIFCCGNGDTNCHPAEGHMYANTPTSAINYNKDAKFPPGDEADDVNL